MSELINLENKLMKSFNVQNFVQTVGAFYLGDYKKLSRDTGISEERLRSYVCYEPTYAEINKLNKAFHVKTGFWEEEPPEIAFKKSEVFFRPGSFIK